MKNWLGLLILMLAMPLASAADVGGFAHGGLSVGSYSVNNSYGFAYDSDTGTGFSLSGGIRFESGLMLRGGYCEISHDDDALCDSGGCFRFPEKLSTSESRVGVFYAPSQQGVTGFRVGGGYEAIRVEPDSFFNKSDGGFLEAALLLNAGRVVSFDVSGSLMSLRDNRDQSVRGMEVRTGAIFHAGPVDIGISGRALSFKTEINRGGTVKERVREATLTIGGAWGFPQ